MFNFDYCNPTHIVFGKDRIKDIAKLIPKELKILVIYGGGSAKRNGTLDEVLNALEGREVVQFGGVEANPTYETMMKAVTTVRQENIGFLLAVGGGSVIDGTKFLAAATCFEGDPWDILLKGGRNVETALPFGTVLTLPATGSEMNCGSVISRTEFKTKLPFMSSEVFPKFSILDPTKTYTLPVNQIANGVVDSFVHIVEQYLTYSVNSPVQDRFSEGLLQTLIEIGPKLISEKPDYELRANFMWVATMALNGLIGVGVPQDWATHMIGHEITALYGIDHAQSLAIILPSLLAERRETKRDKLLQFSRRVWGITAGTEDEQIQSGIDKMRSFFESLGIKTHLSDYNLDETSVQEIGDQLKNHGMITLGERGEITLEVSMNIIRKSL
jgi:NADP-dependent alcohol dehydrogenase